MVRLRSFALGLTGSLFVAGCSSAGTCHAQSSEQTLDGSLTSKGLGGDVVAWAGQTDALSLYDGSVLIAETTTNPWFVGPSTAFVELRMATGPYFRFVLPSHEGRYALDALHAQLCDESADAVWQCLPLTGMLDVIAVSAPCANETCGALEADLMLDPASSPGLAASGYAHLHYAVVTTEYKCPESSGSMPLFGLD